MVFFEWVTEQSQWVQCPSHVEKPKSEAIGVVGREKGVNLSGNQMRPEIKLLSVSPNKDLKKI